MMLIPLHRTFPLRKPARWTAPVLAGAVSIACVACDRKENHGDHSQPSTASAAGHSGEDGHDHGRKETGHADEVTLTPDAIDRYGVKTAHAQRWVLKPTIVAPARVAFNAEAMAHVGSPLRGRAVEITVRLGEQVKKNAALVVIESPELAQAQADYLLRLTAAQAAIPQVDLAKAAWDRAKGLLEKSEGISLTDVQKREAEYKSAVAGQKSAEAAATAAENTLHLLGMDQGAVQGLAATGEITPRYALRAAIDGQVVKREITLGELVSPDRESLMVLADTSTLWVLADVPEARLAIIAPGAKAWVTVGSGTTTGSEAVEPRKFEGHVAFISPQVDPMTRTAQVRIELPHDTSPATSWAVRPGMFAQVEIAGSSPGGVEPSPQVAVPDEAVQSVEGAPAVFVPVAGEPNTFQKRSLKIGPSVGGLVPVLDGLVEGEPFVTSGSFLLKAELGKGSAAHEH